MRAIWKSAVSFGLVNVPVRLYSATENHDVQFRQVHEKDGGRITYQRICSLDGEEVAYRDIAKGYETDDGQMVVLTDDDVAELPLSTSKEIAVERFVPVEQISPMLFDKVYYLEPEKSALKPYALLRSALEESGRVAVVTVALRTRQTVAILRVHDDALVLQALLWPDEVREPDFAVLGETTDVTDAERSMAAMLVESLSGDFEPEAFEDGYEQAIKAVVRAKLDGGEVTQPQEEGEQSAEVVDLLFALQASVDRAKKARGEAS